jgi:hypothetical protein
MKSRRFDILTCREVQRKMALFHLPPFGPRRRLCLARLEHFYHAREHLTLAHDTNRQQRLVF